MLNFTLDYTKRDVKSKRLKLLCGRLGIFDVLSGESPYINTPECSFKSGAAIPLGKYWIVERPKGSFGNRVRAGGIDLYKKITIGKETPPHTDWFGLFNSKTMANDVSIYNISRGSFCLHPLNSDGSGVSEGCITFYNVNDFRIVRKALLSQKKTKVSAAGRVLEVYGYIDVINSQTVHDFYSNGIVPTPQEYFNNDKKIILYNDSLQNGEIIDPLLRESSCYQLTKDELWEFSEKRRIKSELESELTININSIRTKSWTKY